MSTPAIVATVRKDRRDSITLETLRGLTHAVADLPSGQTWCGRKIRGIAHRVSVADSVTVDCRECLTALGQGKPRVWKRR